MTQIMLDKSLNPDLYTWEELAEEAERAKHKLACDRARELGVKPPKRRAVKRKRIVFVKPLDVTVFLSEHPRCS